MPPRYRALLFPFMFTLFGAAGWLASWVFAASPLGSERPLTVAEFTLTEPPSLNIAPEQETSSRRSRLLFSLHRASGEPVLAMLHDVAVLPDRGVLSALLALESPTPLTLHIDHQQRIWSLAANSQPLVTLDDTRTAALTRRQQSVFGMRFVSSFFLLLALGLGAFNLVRLKRPAQPAR